MSRTPLPFHADDISALARSLGGQLSRTETPPSHLELLNMLARAVGRRNFQHFRAQALAGADASTTLEPAASTAETAAMPAEAAPSLADKPAIQTESAAAPGPEADAESVDLKLLNRLSRYFDAEGRLIRWPSKHSHRVAAIWALWARLPSNRTLSEPEVDELLQNGHLFGDHALLRRCLCDWGMLDRTRDCREYRRIERRPPATSLALLERLPRG